MATNNKICVVCGTPYRYCNDCREFLNYPTWMSMFCSEECFNSYEVMSSFENGQTDKETAKKILKGYSDSEKYKNYKKSFAVTYAKIMEENNIDNSDQDSSTVSSSKIASEDKMVIKDTKHNIQESMANETVSQFKSNLQAESKKVYPKAVAHKHGK